MGTSRAGESKALRKKLIKKYKKQIKIVATGNKHFRVIQRKDGKTIAIIPNSPSDHRSLRNCRSLLRRKGYDPDN